ncbi:MAG TPA: DUF5916 domain-containing protein [Candidatus Aminicenantes bacterium]|nr:DUF5916 domain-containing protein [Candidatus Aminicenantes bacterium]HRY64859.1 DUF5916 domain-containing protein [Candidatus Aminicenantes bacterium]HRZ71772.1 DUF5916 domain-containing protein [Candidatus Aminicenantes bacterium]
MNKAILRVLAFGCVLAGAALAPEASAGPFPAPGLREARKAAGVVQQAAPPVKTVRAVRTPGPVALDGRLDEAVWKSAPAASGFTQNDPQDGASATEPTEVWVAYDDHALYVAAFCHDSQPAKIRKRLGRRDSQTDSDWFAVLVDPYFDKCSGYYFVANPAGSITDGALSNDISEDDSWDGVWENKAAVNGGGWTIEIRIPFNQIRFPKKDEYVWGVNFKRMVRRKNETTSFSWVPKNETANVSRFARLEGLRGISPGGRIEFMPYAVAQAQFRPAQEGNPFETGHRATGNAGFDLKLGLKSNLTLDATVNPDFGQVEVDPAVLNLSAYETYYEEKRPFFIEGAALFNNFGRGGVFLNASINWPQPRFFYSRRIGREPQGAVTGDGYSRVPDRTTILGAAKLTGKLGGSWNVGWLNAITGSEFAEIDLLGTRLRQKVEPLSYYGALRIQKEFAGGRNGLGFLATGVARDLDGAGADDEALAGLLGRNAFSVAADGWLSLDPKKSWVIGGWAGATRVEGTAADILRLQNSSVHYFQRPDATHIEVDPAATSLSGWAGRISLAKQSGRFLFLANAGAISPGFDPNDIGFQYGASDIVNLQVLPGYQWTKPGKVFRSALVVGGLFRNYDFGGNKIWDGGLIEFQGELRNFWVFDAVFAYNPETMSKNLTRGGPLALIPSGWEADLSLYTDNRKPVVFEFYGTTYQRPRAGTEWSGQLSARWKPMSNLSLSVGPTLGLSKNDIQWVTRVDDALMTATYGRRYVFGRIDEKVLGSDVRVDWTFTPRLTLQAYIQPFLAVGHYDLFKELAAPKTFDYSVYGADGGPSTISYDGATGAYTVDPDGAAGAAAPFSFGDPDFNYKSLRGTVVLRWEFRPGSLLYLVWTQNRADYANPGRLRLWRDLGDLFSAPGDNIFLLKVSYRWNL